MLYIANLSTSPVQSIVITLSIFILIIVYVNTRIKNSTRATNKKIEKFLKEDREANFSRSNKIDDSFFIKANVEHLPIYSESFLEENYDEANRYILSKLQKQLLECSERKLVYSNEAISNIELKKRFGVTNFNLFAQYEQNRSDYTSKLRELASTYINLEKYEIAEKFLLECKRLNSSSSKTYIMLVKIYDKTGQREKILEIKDYINTNESFNENSVTKEKITSFIKTIK